MNHLVVYMGLVGATAGGIIIVKAQPLRRILGALLIVAGFLFVATATSHRQSVAAGKPVNQGVPLVASDTLIAAKTLAGQPLVLNAEDTPVLFFSPQSSSTNLAVVQKAWNTIRGAKRPVMLVSTGFRVPANAERSTEAFLNHEHVTMPVVIQEGPPTLYVKDTPTMVALTNGRWVQYHGVAAITAHLRASVSLPSQPAKHLRRPAKKGTKKG
jgi:hypothetical protein